MRRCKSCSEKTSDAWVKEGRRELGAHEAGGCAAQGLRLGWSRPQDVSVGVAAPC